MLSDDNIAVAKFTQKSFVKFLVGEKYFALRLVSNKTNELLVCSFVGDVIACFVANVSVKNYAKMFRAERIIIKN